MSIRKLGFGPFRAPYCAPFLCLGALLAAGIARADTPSSGSTGPAGPTLNFAGTAVGSGALNESVAVEGVNGDTLTLTVTGAKSTWKGKVLSVTISWQVEEDDFELYIHQGSDSGPVLASNTSGATSATCYIDPSVTGPGTYSIHADRVAAVPTDQISGQIYVKTVTGGRSAMYTTGSQRFAMNQTIAAPVTVSDGEPSSRTDILGNHYAVGIRGVPAGTDLWWFDLRPNSPTFDPTLRNGLYRGQPDSFTGQNLYAVGADGGGDVDIATGKVASGANNVPLLAFISLVASNISCATSADAGNSFTLNPAGNVTGGIPANDRPWIETFGAGDVYMAYRTLDPAVALIQKSTNGGLTYGPARTIGLIGQIGGIAVDPNNGTVYVAGGDGIIAVGTPDPVTGEPLTYTLHQVANDSNGVAHIFFVVRCAGDGTVYALYSNDKDIFLQSSSDHGNTWTLPVKVNNPAMAKINIFPALTCGPMPGSVGLAWYGTTSSTNGANSDWNVYYAASTNATSAIPTFSEVKASDHVIHAGNISELGLSPTGNANRNLLDYFQISFDPQGAAVIDYSDDHNDFSGNVFVTRQVGGLNASGTYLAKQTEGSQLPPQHSHSGPQVVDAPYDVADALLVVYPAADPLDILSILYADTIDASGKVTLQITMSVSSMATIPPESTWQMCFAANAPTPGTRGDLTYSDGVSDRGDQFYVSAVTDAQGGQTFVYGTVARNSDGSLTFTQVGNADSGRFDPVSRTITVNLSASKLTPLMVHGGPIVAGSVLCGLRGATWTVSGDARGDSTRGGVSFTVK